MPLYTGETTRIQTSATDYNGEALTDENVDTALVNIYRKADNALIVADAAMSYDPDEGVFYYDWQTGATPQDPGSYFAKVYLAGDDYETWEYVRFRLLANPV